MNEVKTINLLDELKIGLQTGKYTKFGLAEDLGISRVTLDTRLQKGNWKKAELHLLKKLL